MTKKKDELGLDSLIAEMKQMEAEFQKRVQTAFQDAVKKLFTVVPDLKAIIWTQYAPYFNDGEECIFSVHTPTFTNIDDYENIRHGEYDGDESELPEGSWIHGEDYYGDLGEPNAKVQAVLDAFSSFIQSDAFEATAKYLFGNHCIVTVTPEGMEVDEYDHD
jgi:hypothetical protein